MRFKNATLAVLGASLCVTAGATAAADVTPVRIYHEFRAEWASDPAFIEALARDPNSHYAFNKRLVLDFEAALERAQRVSEGQPGNFKEVVEKYLAPDYIQHDPSFPAGRDGLLGFLTMVQKSGEHVSHPPVMVVAEGDIVVLTMMRPPVPEPADPTKSYTAYRIAVWKVCGKKLCEHWGPGLKGAP
jgi:predicted SnoaL-like aldol condensation-catalyzing enzyme